MTIVRVSKVLRERYDTGKQCLMVLTEVVTGVDTLAADVAMHPPILNICRGERS